MVGSLGSLTLAAPSIFSEGAWAEEVLGALHHENREIQLGSNGPYLTPCFCRSFYRASLDLTPPTRRLEAPADLKPLLLGIHSQP